VIELFQNHSPQALILIGTRDKAFSRRHRRE